MGHSISGILKKHLADQLGDFFEPDAFFVLGVSGGPDSMALMHLLFELKVRALIVHVNYGKRGEQSDLDQELVEQLAFEWGFECCTVQLDPKGAGSENFQNWAREQRYRFFRDLKDENGADAIITAHHQNDQVETILQKILRGSSPTAWQGMKVWDGELFRPLLPFSKQQILNHCEVGAVPYRIDESNKESGYARNFLRNKFGEQMDRLFPGWEKNILDLPKQGEVFEAAIEEIAGKVAPENKIILSKFKALPQILKTAVLKTVLDRAGLQGKYSKRQLQELAELERVQTGKSMEVGNLVLTRNRGYIAVHPAKQKKKRSHKITRQEGQTGKKSGSLYFQLSQNKEAEAILKMDADSLSWPLTLRHWQPGDSFVPFGMSGSQKISHHLTYRKIPAHLKQKALVLCGSDGTIYAIIYPVAAGNNERGAIAEQTRYKPDTQTFLTINTA